jgi:hypothetical protein
VGRLDKASGGLLLLTNDNRWAADILDPQTPVEKTYHVQIDRIADKNLILLRQFAKSPLFPLWGKLLSPSLEKRGEGRFSDQPAQHNIRLASRHKRYWSE